jgi:hypothetical protein
MDDQEWPIKTCPSYIFSVLSFSLYIYIYRDTCKSYMYCLCANLCNKKTFKIHMIYKNKLALRAKIHPSISINNFVFLAKY